MDPGQNGYRLEWRVPVPGTRQPFHNETGSDLRTSVPYGVDCMFHCGGCPARYHMLWQLHEHLQLHTTGGSYHYNHHTRTAFPKSDTVCRETQTEGESCSDGRKSVNLVCTETQTDDSLLNFFSGRADLEVSNENDEEQEVNVKVKLESTEPDLQHKNSSISDDGKVPVLTQDDLYSGDTDEETSLVFKGNENAVIDFSKSSEEKSKHVSENHTQKVKSKKMKNLDNSKSSKRSAQDRKKNVKKRKHSLETNDGNILKKTKRRKSESNDSVSKKTTILCKYCDEYFPNNLHLKRHAIQAHPLEKNHACRYCDEAFVTEAELQKHRKIHLREKYECHICKKQLSSPQNLQDHITMHTGEKMFECKDCGTYFRSRSQLSLHASRKHNPNFDHMCENCGRVFKCRQNLQGHIKCCLDIRPFRCEICGKRFPRNTNLNVHMRKHTGEKPFVCHTCGMKFMHSNTLTKHMLVHTGERKYACEVCGMKFKAHNALKDHIRIHNQEKRFTCQYCGKGFIKKCNMITHIRQHTGETPYKCKICGQGYKQNVLLKTHMQTHKHEPVQVQSATYQQPASSPQQHAVPSQHSQAMSVLLSNPVSQPTPRIQEMAKTTLSDRSLQQLESLPVHSQSLQPSESSNSYNRYMMAKM